MNIFRKRYNPKVSSRLQALYGKGVSICTNPPRYLANGSEACDWISSVDEILSKHIPSELFGFQSIPGKGDFPDKAKELRQIIIRYETRR